MNPPMVVRDTQDLDGFLKRKKKKEEEKDADRTKPI